MAFRTLSVEEFSDMLAAKTPTPGGGAVAAVTASHAAALGAMVLEFTLGKPKFAEHEASNASALARLRELRHEALGLADRDAEAYGALNALWKLPKDDPARAGFVDAVRDAIAAPEATVVLAERTLAALEALVGTTSASLASDLRIAIDLAAVGARAAQENVRINLPSLADESERASVSSRTEAMLSRIDAAAAALIARV